MTRRCSTWFEEGVGPLVDALTVLDPDAHVWNFSNGHQDGRFWPRRMAIETAIHRWDGQDAHGRDRVTPIDAELASDGMDELLDVHVGLRLAGRDGIDIGGSVHFHCTDTEGEWTVHTDDGLARVTRGHTKGDVAVRGPASSLLLMQWRRILPDDRVPRDLRRPRRLRPLARPPRPPVGTVCAPERRCVGLARKRSECHTPL